jgi:predicted nucleotidyltransferase
MMARMSMPMEGIVAFCRKWRGKELALFGSVLRDDVRPDNDVDVLVTFADGTGWSGWDLDDMIHELESLLGRAVALVEKPVIRNPSRRHEILRTAKVMYAA